VTRAGIAALLVVAAFGLAVGLHYLPHQADDAYIACRHAANLSLGHGPA